MNAAPDFRLDGRIALITGSSGGIGLALARAMAGAGMHLALADIELFKSGEAASVGKAAGEKQATQASQAHAEDQGAERALPLHQAAPTPSSSG